MAGTGNPRLLHWAFVAGLVGGLLLLVGTVPMVLMMAMMGGMDAGCPMCLYWTTPSPWMPWAMVAWGGLLGLVALLGATRLRSGIGLVPWGVGMVVVGVLSFPIMGGLVVGAMATIASGVLALVAASPRPAPA